MPPEGGAGEAFMPNQDPRLRLSLAHLLVVGGSAEQRLRVARAVHDESALRLGPFVAVDCASEESRLRDALQHWLQLGGSERAAHPLWSAERGTLFLDGIGQLSSDTQMQLLAFAARDHSSFSRRDERGAGRLATGCAEDPWDLVAEGSFLSQLADVLDKIRVELAPRRQEGTA